MAKKKAQKDSGFFEGIRNALVEFNEDLKAGKKLTLRTAVIPNPPKALKPADIVRLRKKLNVSQQVFAGLLNASVKTVQTWEQGLKKPNGPSLRLLEILQKHPESFLQAV